MRRSLWQVTEPPQCRLAPSLSLEPSSTFRVMGVVRIDLSGSGESPGDVSSPDECPRLLAKVLAHGSGWNWLLHSDSHGAVKKA